MVKRVGRGKCYEVMAVLSSCLLFSVKMTALSFCYPLFSEQMAVLSLCCLLHLEISCFCLLLFSCLIWKTAFNNFSFHIKSPEDNNAIGIRYIKHEA